MECKVPGCDRPARNRKTMCRRCERAKYPENLDVEKRRASWRAKNHRRRGVTRDGDFTPADEQAMRLKAKRCPLCKVKLVDDPYLPASKELDHIIPRHMFGTHTHGNVRIICREVTYSYEQLDPLA